MSINFKYLNNMPAVATYGGGKAEGRGMNKVMRFHACMQECISARRHVTIGNKLYTHETDITSFRIPIVNE
jgi:hypothetical protein